MARPTARVAWLVGALALSGGCTSDRVVIGAKVNGDRDAGAETADGDASGRRGTPGCNGNTRPATSPSNGTLAINVKGTTRQYVLELPTGYDGLTPAPVLFAFHGSGTSGQEFLGPTYGNVRAGVAGRMLLLAPNALPQSIGETAWVAPFSGDQGNGVTRADVDLFDALMEELKARTCIDTDRVFAMGHGDGAMISNQLACLRGNVLRGVASFAGAGPEAPPAGCTGKVAAFIGHNPNEGDATECARVSGGSCPWTLLWADTGWPTTQFWTRTNACDDPGPMPTLPFAGDGDTGNPLPCQAFPGCNRESPVTLCLYDHWNRVDGPHALPLQWGAKAATDFFLALPRKI